MANYTGTIAQEPHRAEDDWCDTVSATIANLSVDPPCPMPPTEIHSNVGITKSSRAYVEPTALETARTVENTDTFINDYYYRIHVAPAVIALGAVLSAIQEEFIVWNAWFSSKTCVDIDKTNPTEYTLTGQTAPFTLRELERTTYTIDVPKDGSTQFTATITFDFTNETPVVTLSGTRTIAFVWEPLIPMAEKLKWLTQILKSRSGKEQRISLRRTPRQAFSIDVFFDDEQQQAQFEAAIFSWQKRTWGVPVWGEHVVHDGTILSGASTITVDTIDADFRDDSLAIVYDTKDNYEVVKIETKTDSVLTLEVEMQNTFTGSKIIMPVRIAQMTRPVKNSVTPDGHSRMNCDFLVTDNLLLESFSAGTTYQGSTVLTKATYVDGTQDYESNADIVIADKGTGLFNIFSDSEFNIFSQTHIFKNWTKAECWEFREFLHDLYGMQKTVWIPTFKEDMVLTDTVGAADVSFNVANIGLADNMALNDLRTHLAFIFPGGNDLYREITGITESGSNEIITIDSSLGLEVKVGDCEISFLDKYRLAKDEIDISWTKKHRNECRLRFVRTEE